jgi:hypothetical protein
MVCRRKMRKKRSPLLMCRLADDGRICSTISAGRTLPCARLELVSYMDLRLRVKDHEPRFDGGSHSWHLHAAPDYLISHAALDMQCVSEID